MRAFHSARLAPLLCLTATLAAAQKPGAYHEQIRVPRQRVLMEALPPPKSDAHGHPPDNRTGSSPCGNTRYYATYINCTGTQTQPATRQSPPSQSFGAGLFGGIPIWSLNGPAARQVSEQLDRNGPQFPESLRMSDFRVTGFARGLWPVVVDYEAEPGAHVLLTVVTQNAPPAQAILAVPQTGRGLQLLRLPAEFGTTLKIATFSIDATASATDQEPRYLRVYGFGCGPKAVGSVAIDELRFGPGAVSATDPETHFGFHTHTTFDKMKAEFMQVRHPPRSGWLDELGRLKGGWSVGLGVARCAPYGLLQNCPTAPSATSCSRMYVRTCSSSNPTVDTA